MRLLHAAIAGCLIVSGLLPAAPALAQSAQFKFEKECRISAAQAPEEARHFVDALPLRGKIKWYAETGLDSQTYEAKARLNGSRVSVEFSSEGLLQDIEVEKSRSELPEPSLSGIEAYLNNTYRSFRIKKLQFQYSGEPGELQAFFRDGSGVVTLRYELVAAVREESRFALYEFLFSQTGELLEKKEILHRASDNLAY